MIDIHHHLVYGVDDGPRVFDETCSMVREACRQGVTEIIATPHATPGEVRFPYADFTDHLGEVADWCRAQKLDVKIHAGCEILYTDATLRLLEEKQIPTLGGTSYVLVEFSPDVSFERLCAAARMLGSAGYLSVFAHVERYRCLRSTKLLEELHDAYQVVMQVNANTVLGAGFLTKHWLHRAMRARLIDVIATDAHNLSTRRCRFAECYQALESAYGTRTARRLCQLQPEEILYG